MSDKNVNVSVGPGFLGCLLLVFIVLKLCSVITWSWWWVLSPLWIPAGIAIFFFALAGILFGIGKLLEKK